MGSSLTKAPEFAPRLSKRKVKRLVVTGIIVAAFSLALYAARPAPVIDETGLTAARIMLGQMEFLKKARLKMGIPIDPALDPAESGLIGSDFTDLTTTLGDLRAKQTALNPYFAALMVMWLKEAGVKPGDSVAVSLTGSFPSLNLAALSACQAMGLKPLIISSVGSSSYGANIPGFTWLDMEKLLSREGLLPWRSQYASLGGIMETGGGLDGTGYALGNLSILSHGAQYLPENGLLNLVDDIDRRWRLYFEGAPPKAFINVGGGITPLGWIPEAALLDNGLLKKVPATDSRQRGLIFKMFEAGVPVIHLLNIERLAATQHLPISPKKLSVNPNPEGIRWRRFGQIALTLVAWLTLSALWAWRDKLNLSPAKKH